MASYNRVILLGNLCRDPELRKTPGGASVVELRLAVSEVFRNKTTNEKTEKTCYVDVVVWHQQAELCQQYLSKGSPLFVEGRLQYDEWKNPQGETRNKLRVQADRIQLIGGPRGNAPHGEVAPPAGGSAAPAKAHEPASGTDDDHFPADPANDDPPF
jgi:single-strand DNA-binding protein